MTTGGHPTPTHQPFEEVDIDSSPPLGTDELRAPIRRPFGRSLVDEMIDTVGTPLHKISPLLGNAFNNGAQLRTLLGNGYLLVLALAAFLGGWAIKDTHGLAIPPVLWLTLTIMVLGILDAFAGLVATVVFTLGVVFTGHFFSSYLVVGPPGTQGMLYAFTGILTMAFLWFIGPQLPRRIRLLGFSSIKNRFQRRYIIVGDFFVVPLLMLLIVGSTPIFVAIFTGASKQSLTQVTIEEHLDLIKWVAAIAAVVRVAIDVLIHMYFQPLRKSTGRLRGPIGYWTVRILGSLIALALIWEILGTVWQWPVVWILLVSLDFLSSLGERFLKPSSIYRYVPRNLFRIVTLLLFDQWAARALSGKVVTGIEFLAWLILLLTIVISIYAILDGPEDEEAGDRSATWITRLLGMLVVIALFMISQGFWGIPAEPYSNPAAVAVSSNGIVYIADSGNNRVISVSPDGSRVTVGTDLANPSGVAPDPKSSKPSVYIADTNHDRVLRVVLHPSQALGGITKSGQIANADPANVQVAVGSGFSHPTGLATDPSGILYVADTGHNRIVAVTPNGQQFTVATGLNGPLAVATDPFGHLFVANSGLGQILRYNLSTNGHAQSKKVFASGLSRPAGVAADAQGNVYASNTGKNEVIEFQANNHRHLVEGDFSEPRGLAVDGQGHLYVADAGHGHVVLSEPVYTGTTSLVGPVNQATTATLASDGSTYVVNSETGTLEHVTATGATFVARNLNQPSGVAWSAIDRLYVAQTGNGTISQVDPVTGVLHVIAKGLTGVTALTADPYGGLFAIQPSEGKLLTITAQGSVRVLVRGLAHPSGVVQDAYGNIVVTLKGSTTNGGAVWRIVPGGKAEILATGLNNPSDITADFSGNVFFIEDGAHRIWEDRGLLGAQIVWTGTDSATNPTALVSDLNGNLIVYPQTPGRSIHLTYTTTDYRV